MMTIDLQPMYSAKEIIKDNGGPLPLSLSGVYKAIRNGEIPVRKIGGRYMIPKSFLEDCCNKVNEL